MIRALRWIAALGLGIGVLSLAAAYAVDGRGFDRIWNSAGLGLHACDEGGVPGGPERRLAWNGNDAIEISVPSTVRWRRGDGSDIVVRGSPELIAHVVLRGTHLVLDCNWRAGKRDIEITLPGQTFRRIGLSGATRLQMENLRQSDLALRLSGSGNIRAQGAVERMSVTISGSATARLADVALGILTLKISGSGEVEAAPTETADVTISGSGNLKLLSRPLHLNSKISGSGRISQTTAEASDRK
jgi:hypothetical protein